MEPEEKKPLPPSYSGDFYSDGPSHEAGVCVAPPEFGIEASGFDQAPDPYVCAPGKSDPIMDAIYTAYSSDPGSWARGRLQWIETNIIPLQTVLSASEGLEPAEGSSTHFSYYQGVVDKNTLTGLKYLHQALWEIDDPKAKLRKWKSAQGKFEKLIGQVKRFAKSKKFKAKPGFLELHEAVEASIGSKFKSVQSKIQESLPPSERIGKHYHGSSRSAKGFNRQNITDQQLLPGMAAPTAAAPVAGSREASVEAAMAQDFSIEKASVEDFLFSNMTSFVAGKKKVSGTKKVLRTLKSYRNGVLNPIFEEYSKDPSNPEAKQKWEAALAKAEEEIGPGARAEAKSWWAKDADGYGTQLGEANGLRGDIDTSQTDFEKMTSAEDFDAAAVDREAWKEKMEAMRKRASQIFSNLEGIGLSDKDRKFCRNRIYTARQTLQGARNTFKYKLTGKRITSIGEKLAKAKSETDLALERLNSVKAEMEAKRAALQPILDRIDDPKQVPLFDPVKRYNVTLKFTGDGAGDPVKATYGNHHESHIGKYRYWSPKKITDGKGSFQRPKGGERGKVVYEELISKHGFSTSEAMILGSVSVGEGDFHSVNTVDRMRISLGFIQFAGASFIGLLQDMKREDPAHFAEHFEQYGLLITKGMPKDKIPTVTSRHDRYTTGDEVGVPREEDSDGTKNTYKTLVVYDHSTREWVQGLEAMAVLQQDPRYLTLIQSSARHEPFKLAQIKRARDKFLHSTRNKQISLESIGITDEGGKTSFRIKELLNNEVVMYALTARAIAAGSGKGQAKAQLKAFCAAKGIKTWDELKKVPQSEFADWWRANVKKWSRPDKLAGALGTPLSKSSYNGTP